MKHLGIDYGTKKVGIAISDLNGAIAFPRQIILVSDSLVDDLALMIQKEEIKRIVVGKSMNAQGGDNKVQGAINTFIRKLNEKLSEDIDIILQDERGSSVAARSHLYTKGNIANERWTGKVNAKKRAAVDAGAAAVILQRYLDANIL